MHPGPVNRGVELSGEVVDSPQAVITAQVEAGVVVRMAVLYELLAGAREPRPRAPRRARAGRRRRGRGPAGVSAAEPLISAGRAPPAELLLRDVHVLDPRARHRRAPRRARARRRDRRARPTPATLERATRARS